MLILTRSKNQAIVIGDDISVYVIEVREDKVRLGVHAPPEVSVAYPQSLGTSYVPRGEEEQNICLLEEVKSEIHALAGQLEMICGRLQALEREIDGISRKCAD